MYKLSSYIELNQETYQGQEQFFVIDSKQKTKVFLINNTIFDFLSRFQNGNTLELVIDQYQEELQIHTENDKQTLNNQLDVFFNDLLKKHWIVKEGTVEIKSELKTQLNVNECIHQYKITSIIANKKYTDVYLVQKDKKVFVLKLLNRHKLNDDITFDRLCEGLKDEYEFLEKFNSIYINKPVEINHYNKQPFLVLEYIKGESIGRHIENNSLTSAGKQQLVCKILKGFSIIHENDVYHGDIHLSNVLVKKSGHSKIIDFGYANHATGYNRKIKNGGALAFIPPERANRSISHRFRKVTQFQSEVYQIGLLIYYIYMRRLPFEAETWKTIVDEKTTFDIKNYQPFSKRRMKKEIRSFIIKSLNINPEDRFANAQDMLKAWRKI